MRDEYEKQLKVLHEKLTDMGQHCIDAVTLAVCAAVQRDSSAAKQVSAVDEEIDRQERDIEAMCLNLLLHQQPVASDMREITAALKMVSDLERIGDQASDIAELAKHMTAEDSESVFADLRSMSMAVVKMVSESIRAFVRHDLSLARIVIAADDEVDSLFDRVKGDLVEAIGRDQKKGAEWIDLLMTAKYLERIGDHATNVAEWSEYSITGVRSKNGVLPN